MGADLYLHSTWKAARAANLDAYEAAIAKRNKLADLHPEKHCTDPDCHPDLKAAQGEVWRTSDLMEPADAYWRDSYNSTNLFAQIGLDWTDVPLTEMTLPSRYDDLPCENCCVLDADGQRWLIQELQNRQIGNDYAETSGVKLGAAIFGTIAGTGFEVDGKPSQPGALSADDLAYFVAKKAALIALCQKALELGEPIEVSY